MSRAGDCLDNAMAESFFATLKAELVDAQRWPTRAAARTAIFAWIEVFYNRQRRHSALAYQAPVTFEEEHCCCCRSRRLALTCPCYRANLTLGEVVAEDDQRDPIALDEVEELACAAKQLPTSSSRSDGSRSG